MLRDSSVKPKQRTVSSDVRADFESALRKYDSGHNSGSAQSGQVKPKVVPSNVRADFEKCVKKLGSS